MRPIQRGSTGISNIPVLEFLQSKLNLDSYIVAEEKHKDGSPHLHAYCKLIKRCDFTSPRCLDCLITL